ncbi:MAG: exo-alpha-sialidase [Opitutaceae bacterium]|nr:exo-alpha-sialidase [Opitutaceae bacterium]
MIEQKCYIEAEKEGEAVLIASVGYTGSKLEREEILKTSTASDDYRNFRVRRSIDNGRSWLEEEILEGVTVQRKEGGIVTYPGNPMFDSSTGRLYRFMMKRIWPGNELYTFDWETGEHPFHDHVFVSEDNGDSQCLRYEEGPEFCSDTPFDESFAKTNRAYRGQSICFGEEGRAFYPMVCYQQGTDYGLTKGGVVLMRRNVDGLWTPSYQLYISPEISSRGLLEPDAAVLKDGRILIVCRGSNTAVTAGRKWMTWSEDDGRTIAPIEEFRYTNGNRFYSPSSFHRFIRSTKNGKLYWIGNICDEPPEGNLPRNPLLIGEINEETMGLERDSLDVIDQWAEGEPDSLNFSNFQILENRETLDIEITMTRGAAFSEPGWRSSVYQYIFKPL